MAHMTLDKAKKTIGKHMSKVKDMWQESDGIQIILKPEYINTRFDMDGLFVSGDDTQKDQLDNIKEFFADVESID